MVNDIACFFAILGIILMVATNEMNFTRVQDVTNLASWVLNLCITCSTVLLLMLIVYYHRLQLELHCVRNGLGDWRIGLTNSKILMITLELTICAIHPFPRELNVEEPSIVDTPYSLSYTPIDVGLGIPSELLSIIFWLTLKTRFSFSVYSLVFDLSNIIVTFKSDA